jgi:hypothetical protein
LKWGREVVEGEDGGGNLTNVKYKPILNCHNEPPHKKETIFTSEKKRKRTENLERAG